MRRALAPLAPCLAAFSFAAGPVAADAPPADLAVGRIDVAAPDGGLRSYCTGALIAADLVLSAAHCVIDGAEGRLVAPDRVSFRAFRIAGAHVLSRAVSALLTEPGFEPATWSLNPDGEPVADPLRAFSDDIVVLRLAVPIAAHLVAPLPLAETPDHVGAVRVSGYRGDEGEAFDAYRGCTALNLSSSGIGLSCRVIPGTSGAPVLAATETGDEIVAVVSTIAEFSVWMQTFAPRVTQSRIDAILAGH